MTPTEVLHAALIAVDWMHHDDTSRDDPDAMWNAMEDMAISMSTDYPSDDPDHDDLYGPLHQAGEAALRLDLDGAIRALQEADAICKRVEERQNQEDEVRTWLQATAETAGVPLDEADVLRLMYLLEWIEEGTFVDSLDERYMQLARRLCEAGLLEKDYEWDDRFRFRALGPLATSSLVADFLAG